MKKIILSFFAGLLLAGGSLHAQVPIPLPNSNFEQWTSHQGYNVSVLFFSLPVYSAYTTPTGWDYLSYPVNQSVTYLGMTVNINTSVPVVMTTQDTAGVPDSSTAVKLQTIMISDIVNSTVLSLAGNSIDPSLTQQVIPSILSTGHVDIDAIIPILSDFLTDTADIFSMLPTLLAMDVNDFVSGGLPLNGLRPGHLSGVYKYHSAIEGDNGAVIMLGTHYNTTTHQRDIVGVGINLALTDTSVYTPFEVEYLPLNAFVPGSPNINPDSLIVAIVSSASDNMQQGSYLCVDNLALWSAPDTCAAITSFTAVPAIHEAVLNWSITDSADSYELEYGPAGFIQGTGTVDTVSATTIALNNLEASTQYDAYIRTICSDTIYGDWSSLQFTTLVDTCATVHSISLIETPGDVLPATTLSWSGSSQPDHWEVEYGPQGFALGTGTMIETTETSLSVSDLENAHLLAPATWYEFYVRAVCQNGVYGDWASVSYRTFCASVDSVAVNSDNLVSTEDHLVSGYALSWIDNSGNNSWEVRFAIGSSDSTDDWSTPVTVDTTRFEFPPLNPDTLYTVELTPFCGDQNYGETKQIQFITIRPVGISDVLRPDACLPIVSPNPAHGQCEVSLPDNRPAELKLFSLDGRLLHTVLTDGSPKVIPLPNQGVFLLQTTTSNGTTTQKIISQ